MPRIVTHSLFEPELRQSSSWRSYLTSGFVHGLVGLGLLVITFPQVRRIHEKPEAVLIAPQLPEYQPKLVAPARHAETSTIVPERIVPEREIHAKPGPVSKPKPLPILTAPIVKPVPMKEPLMAAAPEVKVKPPITPYKPLPEQPKIDPPAPQVRTGVFGIADSAKGPPALKPVKTGGFGDPNGVPRSADPHPGLQMARVGSFDLPAGSGNAGAGGHLASDGVKTGSFGTADPSANAAPARTSSAAVHTGGFGDSERAPLQNASRRAKPAEPAATPVEILFKPKPAYTSEARALKLEGQVALEVIFLSDGSVRVVRVIHGLGHGLDQAAKAAAQQVRFKPATRGGVAVDTNATIYITFELT
ncbi:MAG: TonB family protein [Acidobacteriaceae bacterium]|nr:TonB family protein [Acidobacteriaceae bacterium]